MGTTRQIPRAEWQGYFERFTRQHLGDDHVSTATVELVSPALGDQVETQATRLLGLTYDPRAHVFGVALEAREHRVDAPAEIWVVEEEGGFISTLELACPQERKELIFIHRSGPLARRA